MKNIYNVIRRPIITEKSTQLRGIENQVVFEVARSANKHEIREAVEKLFKVKVKSVNTLMTAGKPKRVGRVMGRRRPMKKAYVTLREGEELELFEAALPTDEDFDEGAQV